jgi:hypothetical protein
MIMFTEENVRLPGGEGIELAIWLSVPESAAPSLAAVTIVSWMRRHKVRRHRRIRRSVCPSRARGVVAQPSQP